MNDSERRVLQVMVVDEDGEPLPDVPVLLGSRDIDPRTVVEAFTGADGVAEFELTDAHLYNAPGEAHHRVAVSVAERDSDVCSIGLVKARPRRWFNLVYMLKADPPPVDPRLGQAIELLLTSNAKQMQAIELLVAMEDG